MRLRMKTNADVRRALQRVANMVLSGEIPSKEANGDSVMSVSDMIGTGAEFKNVLSGQRLPELDMCLDYVLPAMRDLC